MSLQGAAGPENEPWFWVMRNFTGQEVSERVGNATGAVVGRLGKGTGLPRNWIFLELRFSVLQRRRTLLPEVGVSGS